MTDNIFDFIGGDSGQWQIVSVTKVTGEPLEFTSHLNIIQSTTLKANNGLWVLKGLRSNLRYTESDEKARLTAIQADLGRPSATSAALIPIRKSDAWWTLAQDERRRIFETTSHHTETGLKYLPAVARKLYHCRDIGEPFDFLTWFEYAPEDADFFEELVNNLRKTPEWQYVDREVDIRLVKT